jgi:hypothetical protein
MPLTAIECLINEVKETYSREGKLPLVYIFELMKRHKEMERDLIIHAFKAGYDEATGFTADIDEAEEFADDYFKQRYIYDNN